MREKTGLTDCEGKEICEGDIYEDATGKSNVKKVVRYEVFEENGDAGYYLDIKRSMRVIGSVYDNQTENESATD